MKHLILLALIASACSSPSKADPAPTAARNLVCERMHVLNDKATCLPEYTDAGDGHIHTARVTIPGDKPQTLACGLSAGQLGLVCGPLVAASEPPKQAPQPAPPSPQPAPQPEPEAPKATR